MSNRVFSPTPETVRRGQIIRDRRLRRGMTQDQLAKLAGVSRVMVSYWESGRADKIPLPQVWRLMNALDLELRDIYPLLSQVPRETLDFLHETTREAVREPAAEYSSPAIRHATRRLSDPALTLAMLWDEIPAGDPLKDAAAALIEKAHRAHDPKYWEWSDGVKPPRKPTKGKQKP